MVDPSPSPTWVPDWTPVPTGVPGWSLMPGQASPSPMPEAGGDGGCAQPDESWVESVVTVGGGSWDSEISWTVACEGMCEIIGGAPYDATHSVPPGGACTLYMVDSYGDGWNGGTFSAPGWLGSVTHSMSSGSAQEETFTPLADRRRQLTAAVAETLLDDNLPQNLPQNLPAAEQREGAAAAADPWPAHGAMHTHRELTAQAQAVGICYLPVQVGHEPATTPEKGTCHSSLPASTSFPLVPQSCGHVLTRVRVPCRGPFHPTPTPNPTPNPIQTLTLSLTLTRARRWPWPARCGQHGNDSSAWPSTPSACAPSARTSAGASTRKAARTTARVRRAPTSAPPARKP